MIHEPELFARTLREQCLGPFKDGIEGTTDEYVYESIHMEKVWK